MDFLRTGCKVWAEVGEQRGHVQRIRWYRCRPGAKAFPSWHAFGSTMWEPETADWTEGPGMIALPLKWAPSIMPCPPGQEFHGEPDWYERGLPEFVIQNPEPFRHDACPGYVPVFDVRGRGSLKRKRKPPVQTYGIHGRGRLQKYGGGSTATYGIHGRGRLDKYGGGITATYAIHGRGRSEDTTGG